MNRIVPFTIASFVLATAVAGLTACGTEQGDHPRSGFGQAPAASGAARYADGNRDGKVTRTEALADPMLSASFDRYDADDNDELDRAEFARLEAHARESRGADEAGRSSLRPRSEYPRPQH